MAWERWQFWYEEVVHQTELIRKALMRFLKAKLAQAFSHWRGPSAQP